GDRTASGGTKSVTISDSAGGSADIVDRDQFAGFERRTITKLGSSGNVVDIDINTPWTSAATASANSRNAYLVNVGSTDTKTRLEDGSYRTTRNSTTFDSRGRATQVNDAGDIATTTDDRCTATTFADNAAEWMFDYPATEVTLGRTCGTAATEQSHVISATRTAYDGQNVGVAPTKGNATGVDGPKSFADGTISYQRDSTTTYDAYGRALSNTNAKDRTVTTAYAPATGHPDTVTVNNPKNQQSISYLNRQWGTPNRSTDAAGKNTDYTYDALGRVTAIWGPERDKATQTPTAKYAYRVSTTEPNAVTSERLNAAEEYVKTVAFYDGLMRERSTQSPSPGVDGGRIITEKWYDDRGFVAYDMGPYYNASAVSTTLSTADEADVPRYTKNTYDGAGRVTDAALASLGGLKWSTKTQYKGDRTRTIPPVGGTTTTEAMDARGQLTSLTQHTSATATTGDVTNYAYTPAGQLRTVKDAAGSTWTKTYDIRGRLVNDADPDKGTSTHTYDATDLQTTSTDARGVTLWTGYDELDRKVELRDDNATGTKRAAWTYDAVRPGELSASTRFVGTDEYTTEMKYDTAGRMIESRLRLPAAEAELYRGAGYPTTTAYNPDGSVQQVNQPLVTGLSTDALRYTYDALGNVKTFKGSVAFVTDTIYSPMGEVLQRTSGSVSGKSVYDTRYYDDVTRRETRRSIGRQGTATQPVLDLQYTYDQVGNVTRLDDNATGDAAMNGQKWRQCFTYDHLRQMTKAWSTSSTTCAAPTPTTLGTIAPYADTYTLGNNGNRTKVISMRKPASTVTTTTRTSAFPAATDPRPHATTSVASTGSATGTETFTYDPAGNMSKRSTAPTAGKAYEWDREGRVKAIADLANSAKKIEYIYDADGNRLLEKDSTGSQKTITLNVGTSQIKVNANPPGTTGTATTTTTRTYTIGDEPIATRTAAGVKLMGTDAQNTPLVTIDSNNQSYTKRRNTPYGDQLQAPATPGWPSNKGFLNKTTDSWSGTTHLEAREFDARDGRFISVDPIADFTNPQQLNGYAYAHNTPVTESDPTGLYVDGGLRTNRTGPVIVKRGGKNYAQQGGWYVRPPRVPTRKPLSSSGRSVQNLFNQVVTSPGASAASAVLTGASKHPIATTILINRTADAALSVALRDLDALRAPPKPARHRAETGRAAKLGRFVRGASGVATGVVAVSESVQLFRAQWASDSETGTSWELKVLRATARPTFEVGGKLVGGTAGATLAATTLPACATVVACGASIVAIGGFSYYGSDAGGRVGKTFADSLLGGNLDE
ncbi:RHS repeat-associated core domain-containing protein, partial [Aeromicrobium sp. CF3.5]|uniref:RHS repeat-associated core domain-containing protein n=1 Tax=Aeromicrobium sp. CF3.5 TaxID=3373078 RepID=UPI003EE42903